MKFLLFAIVFIAHNTLSAVLNDDIIREWQSYKKKFNKNYDDPDEEFSRMKIYLNTKQRIQEHNKKYENGEVTYTMGINQFSDWTSEEINDLLVYNGDPKNVKKISLGEKNHTLLSHYEEPEYVNWVERGAVTEVKNQKKCNSSWAFSAVGSIEGQLYVKRSTTVSLSAQNLVDCAHFGASGCLGGYITSAFEYVRHVGLESDSDYPYTAKDGRCQYEFRDYYSKVNISSYMVYPKKDEKNLRKLVANVGPISVTFYVKHDFLLYKGGVYDTNQCSGDPNHSFLIVGYTDRPRDGSKPYWLVKNSWGTNWGEKGFARVAKGHNLCHVADEVTYPVLD